MDEDAKPTFIQKLHDDEDVVKLLLQSTDISCLQSLSMGDKI